jgi:hypothetical protein
MEKGKIIREGMVKIRRMTHVSLMRAARYVKHLPQFRLQIIPKCVPCDLTYLSVCNGQLLQRQFYCYKSDNMRYKALTEEKLSMLFFWVQCRVDF